MKIKTNKKMRLDELIKYIFDNDEANRVFIDDGEDFAVHSNSSCAAVNIEHLKDGGKKCISKSDTFTVEVEEDLTEETEFDELWDVYYNKGRDDVNAYTNGKVNGVTSTSISQILEENSIDYKNVTLAIFRKDTLIWSKDTGIPESGVLEVSE